MRTWLLPLALLAICFAYPGLADQGLVAHYSFNEGSGNILHDDVGGNNGVIHGATFVRSGDGWALRFNGKSDYVDCGNPAALSPPHSISVEAWVYPEKIPSSGEAGIVGKSYDNYVLTYYKDGKCWWYTGASGVNVKAPLPTGGWHHVVGTFDGHLMKLYVDGQLRDTNVGKAGNIPSGKHFYMGRSDGALRWTKDAHFQGMIDEVRIYNRALSAAEVLQHYRTTKLTHTIDLSAFPAYADKRLVVALNLRGLGQIPSGSSATVGLWQGAGQRPLATARVAGLASYGHAEARLGSPLLRPGLYQVRATAMAPDGKALGKPATLSLTWPKPPSWGVKDPHFKVLNSLVTELRSADNLSATQTRLSFTNPRTGWVYFAATAGAGKRGEVSVALAAAATPLMVQRDGSPAMAEAMRRLPQGVYQLVIRCRDGATVKHLVVRAIPEIGYCRVDCGPQLTPYGPCDWPFLKKYVLPNINLAVSRGAPSERAHWERWRQEGKRWIVETPLPGLGKTAGVTADQVEQAWVKNAKVDQPLLDGMIVDEFGAGNDPIWGSWHQALRRLSQRPDFASKVFYPYCGPLYTAQASREFAQTVIDKGWAMALERYLPEQPTEAAARSLIQAQLVNTVQDWAKVQPDIVPHLLIVWGFFISDPPESCDIDPRVDYKAFMDLQFNVLANDPTFFGLYGVTSYLSSYSDEETIRWAAKLYRHYCIEGRTDRLTDYYNVHYIENPDFTDGLAHWTAQPAPGGGVTTGEMPGLSWLEGRYPPTNLGNTFAVMKRSRRAPNKLVQTMTGLQPGRLYSVKMITADRQDLAQGISKKEQHAISIDIDNVEVLPARTFQFAYPSCYAHKYGKFNVNHRAWFNIHNVLFRARGKEAKLTISDWARPNEPGGPIGQETLCNFIAVRPYYPESG